VTGFQCRYSVPLKENMQSEVSVRKSCVPYGEGGGVYLFTTQTFFEVELQALQKISSIACAENYNLLILV
jgi:hypothetical protein